MSIATESVKLTQDSRVELFILDLTPLGGPVQRFAAQLNELNAAIVFAGQTYQPLPIKASGFEVASSGPFPRPRVVVGNVAGTLGALSRQYDKLRGAIVTRKQTRARYLDAVNFAAGNPLADPLAEEAPEIWVIDRTIARTPVAIEWELCNPMDFVGVMLPGRAVHENYCPWVYRSSDCGFTGGAVAKIDDTPTSDLSQDRCSQRLTGCRLRFPNQVLPAGFFPGVGRLRQA